MIMQRTPWATFLPFMTLAAARISEILPLVQLPITTWSILMSSGTSLPKVLTLSGR